MLSLLVFASYTITNLGIPPASGFMNDSGMVAGKQYAEKGYRCFTWTSGKLTTLPEDIQEVYGINAKGQLAVGTKSGPGIWTNGKLALADESFRYARPGGIDDNGMMVGEVATGSEGLYAVAYWPGPKKVGFEYPPRPQAVAPDGSFVGTHNLGLQARRNERPLGWLWDHGKETGIGDAARQAYPSCISRNHHVGGYFEREGSLYRQPFVWFNGKLTELPLPPSDVEGSQSYGNVVSVNDRGEAVGEGDWQARMPDGIANRHLALLWKDGKCFVIQDLVPKEADIEISDVFAINNKGQILVQTVPAKTRWPRSLAILTPKV